MDFIDGHVLVRLTKYCPFGELRDVLQIADWSKALKNQVKSVEDELAHPSIDQQMSPSVVRD